ncbi:MAG TPA: HutD family protein [Bacteroidia bacterium]
MQIHLTKKEQLQTNTWQGGTTTQLAIYPKDSLYKNLDFIFRISTATIDVAQSTFTVLPDVARVLMVLDGELTIQHKGHYNKQLNKFDTDSFSGDWETTSMGKATDFNVMTRGRAKSAVKGFSLQEKEKKEFVMDCDTMAIYVYSGEVLIKQSSVKTILSQGDVALIDKEKDNEAFMLHAQQASDIAVAIIYQ